MKCCIVTFMFVQHVKQMQLLVVRAKPIRTRSCRVAVVAVMGRPHRYSYNNVTGYI